jgi:hypothetical protein
MSVNVLSEEDRSLFLKFVEENAPDHMLLSFVNDLREFWYSMQEYQDELTDFVKEVAEEPSTAQNPPGNVVAMPLLSGASGAPLVPPGTPCQRANKVTVGKIFNILEEKGGCGINELHGIIGGPIDSLTSLMRLLWERRVVTYDNNRVFHLKENKQ